MVVIALAALLAGYAIPNFSVLFTSHQDSEFGHLTKVLRMLRTDAILRSRSYCISFNLKEQRMHPGLIESGRCSGKEDQEEDWPKWLKEHVYPEELELQQARYVSETPGLNPTEAFEILIDSSGFVTPFLLTFAEKEGTGVWEMESKGILGQLEMREF